MSLQEILSTFWRKKILILLCVVVATGAALAYSFVQTPSYESSALISINTGSSGGSATASFTPPPATQELLGSAVQARVATLLHDANVDALRAEVVGQVDPVTGALTITVTDKDPARAQAIAQAYTTAFVAESQALAQAQIDKITQLIDGLNQQVAALNVSPVSNASQITALENTIGTLLAQQEAIKLGEPYASEQVAPSFPTSSTGLSTTKLIAIGMVAGLLAGFGLALVVSQTDTRVRRAPDLEDRFSAPVLGELPLDRDVRAGTVTIAPLQAPHSPLTEALRDLRTSVRVAVQGETCPIILVTSPEPGEGKSFVASNTAAALAMSGARVILVSADFRRPSLEEMFRAVGKRGFSNVIEANWNALGAEEGTTDATETDTQLASVLTDTGIKGLQLVPVGTRVQRPSELFGSPGMQPVIDQFNGLADFVIIDTPPVLAASDTATLAALSTFTILVAAEAATDKDKLERTMRRIEAAHGQILGIVINRVRRPAPGSYSAYSYR